MKIYIKELTELDTDLEFNQADAWVEQAVARCDEKDSDALIHPPAPARPTEVKFNLRKVDELVVISGKIDTSIHLLCSRCASSFSRVSNFKFSTLFCQDPVMAGVASLEDSGKPQGQNRGFARHAHDESLDSEEGFGKDLDITYISEDFISLADLVTEQLQLRLPLQPLCKDDCKGICTQCGADQNVGRCACAKIVKENQFSVLRNLKV